MITHIPYYQILDRLERFIRKNDILFFNWFVGVTDDPDHVLFHEHKVNKKEDTWFYQDVSSANEANRIADYFLNMGCHGSSQKPNNHKRFIYAYRRTQDTNP